MEPRPSTIRPDKGLITQPNKKIKRSALAIRPEKVLIKQPDKTKTRALRMRQHNGLPNTMKSRNLTISPDEGLITQPNKKMKPRALNYYA